MAAILFRADKLNALKIREPNPHPVAYRGGGLGGGSTPPARNSEGPPKSCQIQPDLKTVKNF